MIDDLLSIGRASIKIADIGAAFFDAPAPYEPLLANGLGNLFAFEPDVRALDRLRRHIGNRGTVVAAAIGDGKEHTFRSCGYGMSSLLEPDPVALGYFNLFPEWGAVHSTAPMATRRLDDIDELPQIDFLKMDVQGSELSVLANGRSKLSGCVALQTEISFVTLYKNQATFGEIDRELRSLGMIPHCFTDLKRWPIAPLVVNNDPRIALNQLLEADIVYIRDIIHPEGMTDEQIAKLAAIAHFVYGSPDLAARCIVELQKRGVSTPDTLGRYLDGLSIGAGGQPR